MSEKRYVGWFKKCLFQTLRLNIYSNLDDTKPKTGWQRIKALYVNPPTMEYDLMGHVRIRFLLKITNSSCRFKNVQKSVQRDDFSALAIARSSETFSVRSNDVLRGPDFRRSARCPWNWAPIRVDPIRAAVSESKWCFGESLFFNNFQSFKFTINPVPFRNKWVLYNFSRSGPQNGLSNSSICQKWFQIRSPVLGIVDCYRVSFVFIQFELSIIKTTHSTTQ